MQVPATPLATVTTPLAGHLRDGHPPGRAGHPPPMLDPPLSSNSAHLVTMAAPLDTMSLPRIVGTDPAGTFSPLKQRVAPTTPEPSTQAYIGRGPRLATSFRVFPKATGVSGVPGTGGEVEVVFAPLEERSLRINELT